jgi:hypothetical protein
MDLTNVILFLILITCLMAQLCVLLFCCFRPQRYPRRRTFVLLSYTSFLTAAIYLAIVARMYGTSMADDRRFIIPAATFFIVGLVFRISTLIDLPWWQENAYQQDPVHCGQCGYNLTGNVSGICPECGWKIPPPPKPEEDRFKF